MMTIITAHTDDESPETQRVLTQIRGIKMFIYVKHLENKAEEDNNYRCFIVSEHKQNLIHFSIPAFLHLLKCQYLDVKYCVSCPQRS